jgi:hypothetical protein
MARYYNINGKLYPSVTTALSIIRKPFLEQWRGELGNEEADRIRDEAGELGTEVHDCCQAFDEGREYTTSNELSKIINTYKQWTKAMVKEWVLIETVVYCDLYQYAGRLDRAAILKGDRRKISLLDLKTSPVIGKEVGLQLAAYQNALSDLKIHRRISLQLNKKEPGKPIKVKDFPDYNTDLRLFLYSLELYKYFEGGKQNVSIVS